MDARSDMIAAICKEIELRHVEWLGQIFDSIYFGGGTPSVLTDEELAITMRSISRWCEIGPNVEITLEANPEDIAPAKLRFMKELGINRLSLGVQTFKDESLSYINRNHDAQEAVEAIQMAHDAGFENINADLIFGLPLSTFEDWVSDLKQMVALAPKHVSVYGLTIEDNTVFGRWQEKGKLVEIDEDLQVRHFTEAHHVLTQAGYDHYEVSNYSKANFQSRHNSSYWLQESYYGIGPAAHTYDGLLRKENKAHNSAYIKSILSNKVPETTEILSPTQKLNEYLLTRSRTKFGIDFNGVQNEYGINLQKDRYNQLEELAKNGLIEISGSLMKTTDKGLILADFIAGKLFFKE